MRQRLSFVTLFLFIASLAVFPSLGNPQSRAHDFVAAASAKIERGAGFLRRNLTASQADAVMEYLVEIDYANRASLGARDIHLRSMAQWLVATGNTSERLNSLKMRGQDVDGAVKAGIFGSLDDYALLSELVVVGTLLDIEHKKGPDFYNSTLTF
jgi:hypothetical protein